ncbi:predicted protein [Phaeodactylum tricornutum CCAP 1055/1]|jgi:hypothetical protein|uniref:Uncharacterized protein n=2 Tax=Phaeodactylum tricornutum TaxID=2850 RepID=B7G3H0_PHATC|nr:predicted protein [Phaeodactylum tricornutum CCAP 1055/1]EEC47001.1 predicted protein [Phaeodactylum tricornutum CCAP 1055/1]|eukprot:XP_002181787.1 predicted protein [Phaeodactylum tricornutum CCAP 1055/1]
MRVLTFLLTVLLLSVQGDATDSSYGSETYNNTFAVCSDSVIIVEQMSIVCDSPGAYYYGSKNYRNSATCRANDKARLQLLLQITQNLEVDSYIELYVKGYGTVEDATLYSSDPLCDTLTPASGKVCPSAGYYKLSESFWWGSQSDSYNYTFTPHVTLGMKSKKSKNNYDLGGANTDRCSGNTFVNWTTGVRKSASNTLFSFFVTFGILLVSVLSILAMGYFILRQSKAKSTALLEEEEDNKNNEYHKIAMLGNNKTLVNV